MKTATPFFACALALSALLLSNATQATNLSELPLKPSVLAKPNVIIGMDDSGSMGFEVLLYTNDGAFWWDYNAQAGWGIDAAHPYPPLRTVTALKYNSVGTASSQWRKMAFLFPNGTGTGNRVYGDASNDHFAIMPTTQFAFLRWSGIYKDSNGVYQMPPTLPELSPVSNPQYYNPLVTYNPWAPAQLSTGFVTPAAATVTAVKSHPVLGSYTFNLSSAAGIAANQGTNMVFTALPGMRIPAGAQISVCNSSNGSCGSWSTLASDSNASTSGVTRVAMAYFPATYWVKESCTVPSTPSIGTDSCTTAPDGSTLQRYEIKSGNTFPSGRTYAAELQNFANWFQYYRKRNLMLAGAMGMTMEYLTGMRIGVIPFNNLSGNITMYDADATANTANRLRVAGIFYETQGNGGTPTRETLRYIGEQYKRTDQTSGKYNVVQFACQRNSAFIVTDGFANASSVAIPSYDSGKSAATWGYGTAPYETTYSGTLADLALRYYTNNPRPDLASGVVPSSSTDTNNNPHMNVYGLTLGTRGTIFFGESTAQPTSTSAWPNPTQDRNPASVDDLWHATINARGKMYLANTPDQTALRVQAGFNDMLDQWGAQGSIAVSAVNLDRSDSQAYIGSYDPRGWIGDLTANPISSSTAVISTTPNWSASTRLTAATWSNRVIVTSTGTTGVDFSAANVGATVNPNSALYSNQQIIDYLRGDRSNEGTLLRTRQALLGPVVNAEPVLARNEHMVYLASGDGMLHAFDTATGNEQWAYAPEETQAALGVSAQRGWIYQTLLDATPSYAQLSTGRKLLVGGLGAAGRSYYALDVTSPRGLTTAAAAAQFQWTFPASTDTTNKALMGYTVGRPLIARSATDGDVVLVTSGYDNGNTIGDGKGRLWVLNASTGAVIKTFQTTVGTNSAEAGLANVAGFLEADGTMRYAYGGDLLGNIWRFDLARTGGGTLNAELVATLKDGSGNLQPITATPELAWVSGNRVIFVGTGRLLDVTDFGNTAVQSFYAIADGATLSNARTGLVAQTYTQATDTISANAVNWSSSRGWYVDLPAGQQANTDPIVTYGAVTFTTNVEGGTNCTQSSSLYLLDITTGSRVVNSTFVGQQISTVATSSRVITLRVVNGRLVGTTHKSDNSVFQTPLPMGQVINPSKNAWKEIRR